MNPVEIRDLHFQYYEDENKIINGIDLSINQGEIFSILGPSGCGKSTFCYCICGIIPHVYPGVLKGEVLVFNKRVSKLELPLISTEVGIVFQDPDTQLFSPTVEDEVAFGPENLCLERPEIGKRIDHSLHVVKMEKYRSAHPENLSGGEKQLVAIASVLAFQPQIIIFDESLSQIDHEGRERIKNTIIKLRDSGNTIIMVEHDTDNLDIADRVFFMKDGRLKKINKDRFGDFIGFYQGT
jgi:energy-coupling factor transport system ATP-binding protein